MLARVEREGGCCSVTSEQLAMSIGTNPVVVRRVLSALKAAGLVESKRGVGGGSVLARDARKITLRDVYEAVERDEDDIIGRHPSGPGNCAVGKLIAEYLDEVYGDAEEALRRRLAHVTIDEMTHAVARRLAGCKDRVE